MYNEYDDYDDYDDYSDLPVVPRTHYQSCSDGMCGATDCVRCHPEMRGVPRCAECGEYCDELNEDGLCPDCEAKIPMEVSA